MQSESAVTKSAGTRDKEDVETGNGASNAVAEPELKEKASDRC